MSVDDTPSLDRPTLRTRLQKAVAGLPNSARLSLSVETLRSWIRAAEEAEPSESGGRYLTTAEAAERLSIRPETVAAWAADGRFPNAFKTGKDGQSGEWRIPPGDLRQVRDGGQAQSNGDRPERVYFDVEAAQ